MVAHLDMNIGHREVGAVCRGLAWSPNCGEVTACPESTGPGNVLIVAIESEHITEIFTGFGARGVPAERVAAGTVEEVRRYLAAGVPVGVHLADQILPLLALGAADRSGRRRAPYDDEHRWIERSWTSGSNAHASPMYLGNHRGTHAASTPGTQA